MTLDEACKILNVKQPAKGEPANMEDVMERFKRLFDANKPETGGSFYLQSKVVRARERIEAEMRPMQEKAEAEAETKEGWNPTNNYKTPQDYLFLYKFGFHPSFVSASASAFSCIGLISASIRSRARTTLLCR